eukprot:TRINITY_DN2799_c0_g2_i2.p2 TRINITY_DN2799_c0_g2~~TRINITY_DN2799_c0_g2_i2.p2  ORF type:complete len:156 (-),score=32.00 TRINITY_DN2799_c0_g2_i2:83-550(-)
MSNEEKKTRAAYSTFNSNFTSDYQSDYYRKNKALGRAIGEAIGEAIGQCLRFLASTLVEISVLFFVAVSFGYYARLSYKPMLVGEGLFRGLFKYVHWGDAVSETDSMERSEVVEGENQSSQGIHEGVWTRFLRTERPEVHHSSHNSFSRVDDHIT